MKQFDHAKNSAKLFGGSPKDYIEIHKFFDTYRLAVNNPYHRMFLHNTVGVILCEQVISDFVRNSDGKEIATRDVAEQHIMEDLGKIPTPQDWLDNIDAKELDWIKPHKSKLEIAEKKLEETIDESEWTDEDEAEFLAIDNDEILGRGICHCPGSVTLD